MNRYSESFRLVFRTLLYLIALLSVVALLAPSHSETAAPICFTVAVAGLACSCRPIGHDD